MISVLLIEDNPELRSAIGRSLPDYGLQADTCASVESALVALEAKAFDVLVTDLRMPGQSGLDLLEEISHTRPTMGRILISGFATARDAARAKDLGVIEVLCKPLNVSDLVSAIRKASECRTGFRGEVHGLSLVDLLQMYHYGRHSIALRVYGPKLGEISMCEGEIVHATQGDLTGESAVLSLITAQAGWIQTNAPAQTERTVERPFAALILDLLRTLDEELLNQAPPGVTALLKAFAEQTPELRFAAMVDLERGRTLACCGPEADTADLDVTLAAWVVEVLGRDPHWASEDVIDEIHIGTSTGSIFISTIGRNAAALVICIEGPARPGLVLSKIKATVSALGAAMLSTATSAASKSIASSSLDVSWDDL